MGKITGGSNRLSMPRGESRIAAASLGVFFNAGYSRLLPYHLGCIYISLALQLSPLTTHPKSSPCPSSSSDPPSPPSPSGDSLPRPPPSPSLPPAQTPPLPFSVTLRPAGRLSPPRSNTRFISSSSSSRRRTGRSSQ